MTTIRQKADPRSRLMIGGALIAFMASPAFAQTAAPSTGISEVIVTATKTATNLQRTPIAISVLGGADMEARHAESLISLQDGAVPSLRVATFEARQSALTVGIRGIVPFDANQTARDQGVGVYIDGVYLGRQQGLNTALFDLERIEVLRGPQGTLFGRNTEGGALSIVTKGPSGKLDGRVKVGAGNFGSYGTEVHLNLPTFSELSVKIDGLIQHQDPTTKNPLEGQAGWNQFNRSGGRITAEWKPTDKFTAAFSADRALDENTPFYSQLISYNPYGKTVLTVAQMLLNPAVPSGSIAPLPAIYKVHASRQSVSDIGTVQQPSVDETGGVSSTLKYKIMPNLELRSITAARAVGTNQWDNSGIASRNAFAPNANFGRYSLSDLYQRQFSQEFQAVGDFGENLTYVAGLFYFKEYAKESAATPLTNQFNADGTAYIIRNELGAPTSSASQGWQHGYRFIARASHANDTSYAAYGQATWTPASMQQLHLTLGGRWTKDKRDGLLYMVSGKNTNFKFNYENSRFDPLATVAYDATSDLNVYAKVSTGFRAGGANDRSQSFTPFNPEEVKAYEIGSKMYLMDRKVRLNVAAYRMDRTGTQTDFDNVDTTPGSPTQGAHTEETRNSPGTSKISGFEGELTIKPMAGMTVGASYAYTKVEIPAAPFPFAGNSAAPLNSPFPIHVVYTPPNAASGFVDYEMPVGSMTLSGHIDANYADAQYAFQAEFADNKPVAAKTDSSFIVNASVALGDIKIDGGPTATLSLWSRNLLNEEHVYRISAANRGTIGDYANFNPPRTFGVEANVKF